RKGSCAGGVAICVVQRVVAEERKSRAHSNAAVDDELALPENALGLILVNVVDDSKRMRSGRGIARQRAANGCIDIFREELMYAPRVQVRERKVGGFRKLAFERQSGLHGVGRA